VHPRPLLELFAESLHLQVRPKQDAIHELGNEPAGSAGPPRDERPRALEPVRLQLLEDNGALHFEADERLGGERDDEIRHFGRSRPSRSISSQVSRPTDTHSRNPSLEFDMFLKGPLVGMLVFGFSAACGSSGGGGNGGSGGEGGSAGGSSCEGEDGVVSQPGDVFPGPDGCNTCTCDESGSVLCTEAACVECDSSLACAQVTTCVDGLLFPTGCGPDNCDEPIGPCDVICDPSLICGEALTCVEGLIYPTTCGPANCDAPLGPCEAECDPTIVCTQVLTCHEGKLYPTGCGPANCDGPIGDCPDEPCDQTLACGEALTCFGDDLYPTTCGPANCDAPIGPCAPIDCDPNLVCTAIIICVDGQLYPSGCGPANCDEPLGPCE